jgi:hypothetical protein
VRTYRPNRCWLVRYLDWGLSFEWRTLRSFACQPTTFPHSRPRQNSLAFDAGVKGPQELLASGRLLFKEGGSSGPAVCGSLTLAGKHLFLTSNSGETVVLDSDRKAMIVNRNQLPAGTGSNPVFSGNDMFQRDGDKLWCIGR